MVDFACQAISNLAHLGLDSSLALRPTEGPRYLAIRGHRMTIEHGLTKILKARAANAFFYWLRIFP